MTICGSVVLDICQHFVERWNEIKRRKVRIQMNVFWATQAQSPLLSTVMIRA